MENSPKKVAILGGGLGSLASAFEITSQPGWKKNYDVTVYQVGWRLGGKMTGGRGKDERIEELGLHLLLGFYTNAYRIFREVYREKKEKNLSPDSPLQTFEDAILPNNSLLFVEYLPWENHWVNWPIIIPPRSGYPDEGAPTIWDNIKSITGLVLEAIFGSPYGKNKPEFIRKILDFFFSEGKEKKDDTFLGKVFNEIGDFFNDIDKFFEKLVPNSRKTALNWVSETEKNFSDKESFLGHIRGILDNFGKWIEKELEDEILKDNSLRRLLIIINLTSSIIRGILTDVYVPKTGKFDFNNINEYDFRQWLKKHGASDLTIKSVLVQFFYNAPFNNLIGNKLNGGAIAAGTALLFLIQGAGYRGSIFNQLEAGTCDTLVVPLYQVLKSRGVKFEFFHRVKSLVSDSSDKENITSILIEKQADLIDNNNDYNPLQETSSGVPSFRNEPDYDQISPDQAIKIKNLQDEGQTLESPWCSWTGGKNISLIKGIDFDEVIMGIPVSAQKDITGELIENDLNPQRKETWKKMVENIVSTQVMSAQLWSDRSVEELGFDRSKWGVGNPNCQINIVTYAYPVFSILEQTQFLKYQKTSAQNSPQTVLAFTNSMMDPEVIPPYSDHNFNNEQHYRVREMLRQWLWDHSGWLFPKAASIGAPQGLDWNVLNSSGKQLDERGKFLNQYFKAAVNPSDRYISAAPGTGKYRIKPGKSGYQNLFLCGDWTDFGANFGYMEGTVISSILAVSSMNRRYGFATREPVMPDDLEKNI